MIPYVKINVRGSVVGTLHLLGVGFKEGTPLQFLFMSNDTIKECASMCEGVFDSIERNIDINGASGESFIAEKLTGRNEVRTSLQEKLQFMKHLAKCLGDRIEANLKSRERPRS
jgi:hypothetical protein